MGTSRPLPYCSYRPTGGFVRPDFAPVTEKLRQIMTIRHARGGAAVAVYHRGELVVDVWMGERDAGGSRWERDTTAMSFSTTKGVVATACSPRERWPERGVGDA